MLRFKNFAVAVLAAALLATMVRPPVQAAQTATYSQLMASLKNGSSEANKFRALMGNLNQSQFTFVDVSTLAGFSQNSFETAVKKAANQIGGLRDTLTHTTLTDNDGVTVLLSTLMKGFKTPITVDQIVAVSVGSGNAVTVFYRS